MNTLVVVRAKAEANPSDMTREVWDRIETAREILGWNPSKMGTELLGERGRTAYTTQKQRGFTSAGKARDQFASALAERQKFRKEWLLLGQGTPLATSPPAPKHWGTNRRDLAKLVLLHRGNAPDVVDELANQIATRFSQSTEGKRLLGQMGVADWVYEMQARLEQPGTDSGQQKWKADVINVFLSFGASDKDAAGLAAAVVAFHEGNGDLPPAEEAVAKFQKLVEAVHRGKARGIREL